MATIPTYNFTDNDIIEVVNMGKESTINNLVTEGVLTQEQADKYLETHMIIAINSSLTWGKKIKTFFGYDDPSKAGFVTFKTVKLV